MSRSYHVTKKSALAHFASGDTEAPVEFSEKIDIKKAQKKYRKIYGTIHPSSKPGGLRNDVTVSALKGVKKRLVHNYLRKQLRTELGATPTGGQVASVRDSGAAEGPPSAS